MLAARQTRRGRAGRAANTSVPSTLRQHASAQTNAGACAFTRTPCSACAADAGPPHTLLLPLPLYRFPSLHPPLHCAERRREHSVLQLCCAQCLCLTTRMRVCGVRARMRSSGHLLGGTTGCRRLSLVTFQAKTLSALMSTLEVPSGPARSAKDVSSNQTKL